MNYPLQNHTFVALRYMIRAGATAAGGCPVFGYEVRAVTMSRRDKFGESLAFMEAAGLIAEHADGAAVPADAPAWVVRAGGRLLRRYVLTPLGEHGAEYGTAEIGLDALRAAEAAVADVHAKSTKAGG